MTAHATARPAMVRAARLGLGLWLLGAGSAAALDASERQFIWQEANARLASARTPADARRAAQTYQKLVDAGVRNGPLFYNLGTALLQAGQPGPAADALLRAERYLGAAPDLRRNLAIALARKADTPASPMPWQRAALFWHYRLTAAQRAALAAACFSLFWVLLALRRIAPRLHGMRLLLAGAGIGLVLFGSSTLTSWHQEASARTQAAAEPAPGLAAPTNGP